MFAFDRPSSNPANPEQWEDFIGLMWVSGCLATVGEREQWIGTTRNSVS